MIVKRGEAEKSDVGVEGGEKEIYRRHVFLFFLCALKM